MSWTQESAYSHETHSAGLRHWLSECSNRVRHWELSCKLFSNCPSAAMMLPDEGLDNLFLLALDSYLFLSAMLVLERFWPEP